MANQASHRPRKKKSPSLASSSVNGTTISDPKTGHATPAFPLSAFLWPAKSASLSQWTLLPTILMAVGLFRWALSFWPYSGMRKPPMHGDFEAQRHWMELTVHLPATHWYFHDLEWWGLDYPPLTAYHSWVLGRVGAWIDPEWFALYLSRGNDDAQLKLFMRATVIVSEYLIYVPAAVICVRQLGRLHNVHAWESAVALTALLMQPATMLIDHGHFQYNTVMLGFMLASVASMLAGRRLWSCVFFVAALGFKQMALFYAPAVAAYLAGTCLFPRFDIPGFILIAFTTIASFAALFAPLLLGTAYNTTRAIPLPSNSPPPLLDVLPAEWRSTKAWYYPYILQLAQSIHRIFPFARGLFEDKVANIWCAVHTSGLHKLHRYDSALLSRAALGLTLASITPPCILIFVKPKRKLVPYAFAATAWGFFLCSYQVHEKNVLLPLLPMTLILATKDGMKPSARAWVGYANTLACWTLFPLLKKDELVMPYFVLTLLWAYILGLPPASLSAYFSSAEDGGLHWTSKVMHIGTYLAMILWHIAEFFVAPPQDKPDLWVVGNVCIGAAGFGLCYLWCLSRMIQESGFLRTPVLPPVQAEKRKKKQ